MSSYYEIELPPNADLYKGDITTDGELTGLALYLNRKTKTLLIGTCLKGQFEGMSVCYDFNQDTLY